MSVHYDLFHIFCYARDEVVYIFFCVMSLVLLVTISVNNSESMPDMGLSSGFDTVSGLKIPGWISRSGLSQWYCGW